MRQTFRITRGGGNYVARMRRVYRAIVPYRLRRRLWVLRQREPHDDHHPERLAVLPYVRGRCLEVGCGHRKTHSSAVGVDLTPGGQLGTVGNVKGRRSQADVAADGGALPFRDGAFDSLIARHNLEHYDDTRATLTEWCRVLAPGGTFALVVPDEERYPGSTLELDPTHYQAFTEQSLRMELHRSGFLVAQSQPVIEGWSFAIVGRRPSTIESHQ
jgi:SAM-dependent methyltransferase